MCAIRALYFISGDQQWGVRFSGTQFQSKRSGKHVAESQSLGRYVHFKGADETQAVALSFRVCIRIPTVMLRCRACC
jgi:hypothetical protein